MSKNDKEVVKGPTMPPEFSILEDIAKKEKLKTSTNWLGFDESNEKEDGFSTFGKSFKKPKDDERRIADENLKKIQSERELNPYWKGGDGTGFPMDESKKSSIGGGVGIGDNGLTWWTKSLERCYELSKSTGKSVEEIAAERYGSLESLKMKIEEAKSKNKSSFMRPGNSGSMGSSYRRRNDEKSSSNNNWRKSKEEETKKKYHRSSSSSSEDEKIKRKRKSPSPPVSLKHVAAAPIVVPKVEEGNFDLNELGAKLIKAELMEDEEMIVKIKKMIEIARTRPTTITPKGGKDKKEQERVLIASRTDRFGNEMPISKTEFDRDQARQKNKGKKLNQYSEDGKQIDKYFVDDNKYSLKDLVERERQITADDNNYMYSTIKTKALKSTNEDFDDDFIGKCANKQLDGWSKIKVMAEQKTRSDKLNNCDFCFENYKKHLIVSIGSLSYLALPNNKSFVDGHCLIIPIQHYISSLMVDEDVWEEMNLFRKSLVEMFKSMNLECIFIETFINEKNFEHMCIECIPLDKEASSLAPMYFKKAISEAESEWAQNKQIVYLKKGGGIRNKIPKGLPYFSVEFGLDEGIAHVVENKNVFPKYFAKEIIGGLLDLDANSWRRLGKEEFSGQRSKVLNFNKNWKLFDFNKKKTDSA